MANSAGTILLLAGAGAAAWWAYETFFSTATLPADAVPVLSGGAQVQLSSGQSATAGSQTISGPGYVWYGPSENTYYVSATAATAAQISAASSTTSSGTTGSSTNGTTPATTSSGSSSTSSNTTSSGSTPEVVSGEPTTYPTPGGGTGTTPTNLAGLWSAMQAWAGQDTNFTGSGSSLEGSGDHWMFYVTEVWPNAPAGYPSVWPPNWATVFPGVDESQQMTASTFWGGMQPYLQSQGLSGMRGLGCDGGGLGPMLIAAAALGVACLAFGKRGGLGA